MNAANRAFLQVASVNALLGYFSRRNRVVRNMNGLYAERLDMLAFYGSAGELFARYAAVVQFGCTDRIIRQFIRRDRFRRKFGCGDGLIRQVRSQNRTFVDMTAFDSSPADFQ